MTSYERLQKALYDNKDSFDVDEDGIITVKESAIIEAVKKFNEENWDV